MKKYIIFFCALALLTGCGRAAKEKKEILAKINDYEITAQEFEEAFQDSASFRQDNLESRKESLDSLINQKLILQEAQKKGLDKEPGFLKAIEHFWEQSLLKIAADKKTREISASVRVSETEVQQAFDKLPDTDKAGKTYQDLYGQIKWKLNKDKEEKNIESWLTGLRQKAAITVNYELLKKDK